MTVKQLIKKLQTCKKDAKVYYTLGGSSNVEPITYFEENSVEVSPYDFGDIDADNHVLIGKQTW